MGQVDGWDEQVEGWTKKRGGFYPPKWMVKIMVPNPIKMDDLGGPPEIFLETPIYHLIYIQSLWLYCIISICLSAVEKKITIQRRSTINSHQHGMIWILNRPLVWMDRLWNVKTSYRPTWDKKWWWKWHPIQTVLLVARDSSINHVIKIY